jgi:hypothetical protein
MAGRSLALILLLGLPAAAHASTTDAQRFGRFAAGARASGTITLTLHFSGLKTSGCEAAGTCGVSGTVTAKLKLDPHRKIAAPRNGVAVLPGKGTVTASVAKPRCQDKLRMTSAGIAYAGDGDGLLLRPGAVAQVAGAQDPFATRCAGPGLLDIGNDVALPSVRLKAVPSGVSEVKLTFRDSKDLDRAGYAGSVSVRGQVHLRRP